MRKLLAAAVLVLGGLGAVACQPTEPAMTITAKPASSRPGCGSFSFITGAVSPPSASETVTLQRTVGGKWTDWKNPGVLTAKVSSSGGHYSVPYKVPDAGGVTYHLRVRSAGGTKFSPGFYITTTEYDIGQCL